MDELIQKIDELINAINNNNVPIWLTWVGVLVPILISIAVIVQASVQAKNNKKFQKHKLFCKKASFRNGSNAFLALGMVSDRHSDR